MSTPVALYKTMNKKFLLLRFMFTVHHDAITIGQLIGLQNSKIIKKITQKKQRFIS